MPTFANMAVSAANKADNKAYTDHMVQLFVSERE